MKSKISIYTAMPNVARIRSRIANPSKDLTAQLRGFLTEAIIDVVNHNTLAIRAAFIQKVSELGLEYKNKSYKAAVESVLEPFFDTVAAATAAELNAKFGDDEEVEAAEGTEAPADEKPADDFE